MQCCIHVIRQFFYYHSSFNLQGFSFATNQNPVIIKFQWAILLTWFHFNPNMDK